MGKKFIKPEKFSISEVMGIPERVPFRIADEEYDDDSIYAVHGMYVLYYSESDKEFKYFEGNEPENTGDLFWKMCDGIEILDDEDMVNALRFDEPADADMETENTEVKEKKYWLKLKDEMNYLGSSSYLNYHIRSKTVLLTGTGNETEYKSIFTMKEIDELIPPLWLTVCKPPIEVHEENIVKEWFLKSGIKF